MADFTLNAPGTTNAPWSPTSVIVPISPASTIKSDATGFRATAAGVYSAFAHDVAYGTTITATCTIASGGTSNGDEIFLGGMVRTGANAASGMGIRIGAFGVNTATWVGAGTATNISTAATLTRANADVYSTTIVIVAGTATITAVRNGTPITFSASTTTLFTGEASLAAGAAFSPFNNDSLYLGQFTGTGVASATSFTLTANSGTFAMTGEAATLSAPGGASSFTLLANSGTFNMSGATSTTSVGINAVTGLFAFLPQNATLNWPQGGLVDTGVFGYKNVFVLGSAAGLVQWVDYIPVQFLTVTADKVNRYVPGGALACKALGSVTGLTKWVDYIPVFVTSNTGTFRTDDAGYIPMVKLV